MIAKFQNFRNLDPKLRTIMSWAEMPFLSLYCLKVRLAVLLLVYASLSWHEANAHGYVPLNCQRVVLELVHFPLWARTSGQECSDLCDQQFDELMKLIYSRVPGPHMLSRKRRSHHAHLNPKGPFFNVDECVQYRLFCFNTADAWLVDINEEKADLKCIQKPALPICATPNLESQLRSQYDKEKQSCGVVCSACMCRRFLFMFLVRRDRDSYRGREVGLLPPSGFGCSPDDICKRFHERAQSIASGWSCIKGHYAGDVLCEPLIDTRCKTCHAQDQKEVDFPIPCLNAAMMFALLTFSQKHKRWIVGKFEHLMDHKVRAAERELKVIETRYYIKLGNDPSTMQDLTNIDSFPRTGHLYTNLLDELLLDSTALAERQYATESSTSRAHRIQESAWATLAQAEAETNSETKDDVDWTRLPWEIDQLFSSTAFDESMFASLDSSQVRWAENLDSLEHRSSTSSNLVGGATTGDNYQSVGVHQPKRPRWSIPMDQMTSSRPSMSELESVSQEEHELGQGSSAVDLTQISLQTSSGQNSVDLDNLQFSDFFRDLANSEQAPVTADGAHSPKKVPGSIDPDNLQFTSYFATIGELSDEVTGLSTKIVPDDFVNQGFPDGIDGIP